MNFKDFLTTFDSYLQYENLFSSHYYGYVNNVFVEKKLLYPILIYHKDAMNHSILDNSITVLKFNFFVFDKLKTDNSNIIDVQDDLLKRLVKIQSYLKRKFFATNFNITAISDEAYSEKITGWVMDCLIKLDTSEATCIDMRERYLIDGISKYDRQTYTIIECLLPSGSEAVFPNYTYFLDDYRNPVDYIENIVFRNMKFYGNFYMNNLKKINDYEFENSVFQGYFRAQNVESVGGYAFTNSKFIGNLNLPKCTIILDNAFRNSNFTGDFECPNLQAVGIDAFYLSVFDGNFNCPNLQTVGKEAFRNSQFTGNCNLQVCEYIDYSAFFYSLFNGTINLQVCEYVGDNAFNNSNFTTITIGANAELGTNCIGAHSAEFINDYAANGKLAGTYVWDAGTNHWIYQS